MTYYRFLAIALLVTSIVLIKTTPNLDAAGIPEGQQEAVMQILAFICTATAVILNAIATAVEHLKDAGKRS